MENESAVLDQEQIEQSSPSRVEANHTSTEIETKMEEPGPAAGDPPATEEPAKETEQPATEGEEEKPADGEGPAAAVHGSPIK